ncbi:peptidoglycan editing factor PgeF [Parahaliea aestuarii]|uniref:Purine nucleoside phosphorylase n=1 Tax=Parahaliea aestuarii TaxID=1852021 RepID=A0A5C8ZQE1_9GAMM|nr:peptidoglycan editing factor PgeF [Parahaliea aestuarii]TXS90024.1 peptidoglycan editing factor PgeF [Parahaliea aestuarii]
MIIPADWPAPGGVIAFSTTRAGGHSRPPCQGLNLGHHVGDDPMHVAANRQQLRQHLPEGCDLQWLNQVHGTAVVAARGDGIPEADAAVSTEPGIACTVLTADCLPVLFCDRDATCVAAAHAGWRGLQAGVLEATVAAMPCDPDELLAWLGPAIGPAAFEVGPEVREAFCQSAASRHSAVSVRGEDVASCFTPSSRPGRFLADIFQLARLRLASAGVSAVYGGGLCTFSDEERFFSYRRDGQTGRMASVICFAT